MNIYRGDIYYIENAKYRNVEYQTGTGSRPAVIVSNDKCNAWSDECTVVYLTTKDDRPDLPTHVPVICRLPSTALCETVCKINQNKIGEFVRACTAAEMQAIDKALMIQLGIETSGKTAKELEALEAEGINAKKALDWSESERAKLTAELEKRNEAYEELEVKRDAMEAEYRRMAAELDDAKISLTTAVDTEVLRMRERDELRAELNAEKAVSDRYAQEFASLHAQRDELETKLEEHRTCENAKIKELQGVIDQMTAEAKYVKEEAEAMLDAEKDKSLLYKTQLDAQVAANEHLQSMLDARAVEESILKQVEAGAVENIAREENIRLKAELDVYKAWLGKLVPQLA